jgi:hypothetical protein
MKKKVGRPRTIQADEPVKYIIEDGLVPTSKSPIKQSPEYQIMDQMKVNQSVSYPPSKANTFDYARNTFHRESVKRFIIRTVDKRTMRIFRIEDGEMGKKLKTRRKDPMYA